MNYDIACTDRETLEYIREYGLLSMGPVEEYENIMMGWIYHATVEKPTLSLQERLLSVGIPSVTLNLGLRFIGYPTAADVVMVVGRREKSIFEEMAEKAGRSHDVE